MYALISEGRFPKPVKLSPRSARWKASAVYAWIESLPTTDVSEGAAA
nr:AlpA family phage regulatory protein [uncultured Desulfobulbus sp.]